MADQNKVNVVIVDDEKLARDIIKNYLNDFSNIQLVAETDNGFDAVKVINSLRPNIVFVDIQMPKLTGFELIELLDYEPAIIFSTAFDEYAIKAFDVNAVDYLLKPYSKDRFNSALQKAMETITTNTTNTSIDKIESRTSSDYLSRILIKKNNNLIIIPVNDIYYLEASDDYVTIHSKQGNFLKQKTMKYYELNLSEFQFVRIHRSYIVNISFVKRIVLMGKEQHQLLIENGDKLSVSKSGYKKIKEILN